MSIDFTKINKNLKLHKNIYLLIIYTCLFLFLSFLFICWLLHLFQFWDKVFLYNPG